MAVDAGMRMKATDTSFSDDRRIMNWPTMRQGTAFFIEFSREQAPDSGACGHAPADSPNAHVSCGGELDPRWRSVWRGGTTQMRRRRRLRRERLVVNDTSKRGLGDEARRGAAHHRQTGCQAVRI